MATIEKTDAEVVEIQARLIRHLHANVNRREETIARLGAMLDQRDAALEEVSFQHRQAWREVERLRRLCRNHGVDHVTGGAS